MTVAQVRATLVHISDDATDMGRERSRPGEDWEMPLWPYTWWGRSFRALSLPFDLLYRASVTRTLILGGEHLADLPPRVIFAGTHRSYADLILLQTALSQTAARGFARRLVVAAGSARYSQAGLLGKYATLAYGLYPLQQYHGRAASLRGLAQLAALGNAVLIFPRASTPRPRLSRPAIHPPAFVPASPSLPRRSTRSSYRSAWREPIGSCHRRLRRGSKDR
jgi:1-acyl-sn-glycerol-3-phosphate acyltransferase